MEFCILKLTLLNVWAIQMLTGQEIKIHRKSTSGYCFKLGTNNGIISWRTNKQSCVALSTAEAEYVALANAAQESVWLNHLFSNLND